MKAKSKRSQREAQRRNFMRFRLLGTLSSLNPGHYDQSLFTPAEEIRLRTAYDAVSKILDNFREQSSLIGFGEPRVPKKFVMKYQRIKPGVFECWWKNFTAMAAGETFDRMALAAVESLNRYMKVIGSSRIVQIEDLKFKCIDDE